MTGRSPSKLNHECFCITLDRKALFQALAQEAGDPEFWLSTATTHPHLFSNVAVFLSADAISKMRAIVGAIERVAALDKYRSTVLQWAPQIAEIDRGPVGAFMGYDFHLSAEDPKLIEVNTNAGGAFLNAFLARAQSVCCPEARRESSIPGVHGFDSAAADMFQTEWRRQRGDGKPRRIAIVDDAPADQYLYPEFLLAQRFFQDHGIEAVITDPKDLVYDGDRLRVGDQLIDLVYNRLVDFSLERSEHDALRRAYVDGAVVLTPNPHAHALFADKRNLTLLNDAIALKDWGLDEGSIAVLAAGVPHTVVVVPELADGLWKERRHQFFKPVGGHGSRGAYRGDKVTKGVWGEITKGGYVAQLFAPPGDRAIKVDGGETRLKADIRLYTYAGNVLLVAARLYQGQTTNFRTPSGGFAPVFEV